MTRVWLATSDHVDTERSCCTRVILIWEAGAVTWSHRDLWALAATKIHDWIHGPEDAAIWGGVCDSGCQRVLPGDPTLTTGTHLGSTPELTLWLGCK